MEYNVAGQQKQHYWFIELIAFWEGQINATQLIKTFKVSRQTASSWLKHYQDDTGNRFEYSTTAKAHCLLDKFVPTYITQTIDEYLDWIEQGAFPSQRSDHALSSTLIRITPPDRFVSPDIIRPIMKALKLQTAVDCEYLSVKSADPIGRLIYPHTFVKTANRWHVRAYCAYRKHYLDFVLSRFQSVDYDGAKSEQTKEQDTLWNTEVSLVLSPDSRLNEKQRQVIEMDYGMTNGQLVITTRAALIKYTLDDLQIKTKMLEADPQAQQFICVNYPEIKQWLFD